LQNGFFESGYSVLCEVWVAGSDPEKLKAKLARYETAVKMLFVTAGFNNPADFVEGAALTQTSGVDMSVGKAKYRPIKAEGPNFYQDMVQFPFKVSYLEV
jgi:hypothetical protein